MSQPVGKIDLVLKGLVNSGVIRPPFAYQSVLECPPVYHMAAAEKVSEGEGFGRGLWFRPKSATFVEYFRRGGARFFSRFVARGGLETRQG